MSLRSDDPYPFKRSLFGGGDYQSLGTSLGRVYVERVSQSGVSARCPPHPPSSWGFGFSTIHGYGVWHSPSQMLGLDLVPRTDWSVTVRPRPGMVEVRTPIFPFLGTTLPETIPSLPSPSRLGSCHAYDKGRVFQVPLDMDSSPFYPSTE